MTWNDALAHLNDRTRIRRAGWASLPYSHGVNATSMHIELEAGTPHLYVVGFGRPHPYGHKWTATDKAATDWEVVP